MKTNTRKRIGAAMMAAGVAFGLYAGLWLMLVGGIVQVVHEVRGDGLDRMAVAIGIARIFFAGPVWGLAFCVLWIPGRAMLRKD